MPWDDEAGDGRIGRDRLEARVVATKSAGGVVGQGQFDVAQHVAGDEHAEFGDPDRGVTGHVRVVQHHVGLRSEPGEIEPGQSREAADEREHVVTIAGPEQSDEFVAMRAGDPHGVGRSPAGDVAEVRMPQHVVVVGVRGQARDGSEPACDEIGGQLVELVLLPARIDQQRAAVLADDDDAVEGVDA